MKIVSAAEMREIDRASSEEFQVPSLTLMQNAGEAVAEFALLYSPAATRITVVCGKGNNGGDGLVAARRLHELGKRVTVLLLAQPEELRGDAAEMLRRLPVAPLVAAAEADLVSHAGQVRETDLLIDAILGTGFKPPVKGLYSAAIDLIWESRAPVISVDIPSAADADSVETAQPDACRSTACVTFTAPKRAHAFSRLTTGPVVVTPIGSPEEAIRSSLKLHWCGGALSLLREPRRPDSHKGLYGHVLVVGGSVGKSGAAAMASLGAMRAGAGLTTAAVPRGILPLVAGAAPELMTEPLAETEAGSISRHALDPGALEALLERKSVVALGPGLSQDAETIEFARGFVRRCEAPLVLDADGLNAFAGHANLLHGERRTLVLTPHPGEMARLAGVSTREVEVDRIQTARTFAGQHKCIVVLKGWRTLVAEPEGTVFVNTTGNPGMAKGGSGDVLTGMIAGLLAQYPARPVEAVCAAVHLHGLAADLAVAEGDERSLLATEIATALPRAFRAVARETGNVAWLQGRRP